MKSKKYGFGSQNLFLLKKAKIWVPPEKKSLQNNPPPFPSILIPCKTSLIKRNLFNESLLNYLEAYSGIQGVAGYSPIFLQYVGGCGLVEEKGDGGMGKNEKSRRKRERNCKKGKDMPTEEEDLKIIICDLRIFYTLEDNYPRLQDLCLRMN